MTTPLLTIARFELLYHLRRPAFYVFAALTLEQGVWSAYQMADLYNVDEATIGSYLALSSLGVVLAMGAVLLGGQSLTKDLEYRTAAYLYTLPVTSRQFFAGRFLGTYLSILLLGCWFLAGVALLVACRPVGNGSVPWVALLDGYVRLLAVNAFIVTSLSFSLTALLRDIRGSYIVLFGVVLYFLLTEVRAGLSGMDVPGMDVPGMDVPGMEMPDSDLWQLLDPFAVGMVRESVDAMTFAGDSTEAVLELSDMLFINRLLWLGLALGLLTQAERLFTFQSFGAVRGRQGRLLPASSVTVTPSPQLVFDTRSQWRTVGRLAWLDFLNLVRQPVFPITTGLLLLLSVLTATAFSQHPDFPTLPLTADMTALRLPMGVFIGVFLLTMTGELLFQERTLGLWPIYDALPQPTPVLIVGKLLALAGVTLVLTLTIFLTGVVVQIGDSLLFGSIMSGAVPLIDWSRYMADLLMDGLLRYAQLIALGALVATLVNERLLSHVVSLTIFLLLCGLYVSVSSQTSALFSFLPDSARYSDLIGYGGSATLRPWVHVTWWGLSGLFVTLALLTWQRGVTINLSNRLRTWPRQLTPVFVSAMAFFGLVFAMGVWQQHNQPPTLLRAIPYHTRCLTVPTASGRPTRVTVTYYHPYQVTHVLNTARRALRTGEKLFGAYPYPSLHITEAPAGEPAVQSSPGMIRFTEKEGWTADPRQPQRLDYVDYLVSREVFQQWLTHRLNPRRQPGDGLLRYGLAEYEALRFVGQQYGSERLRQRLAQRSKNWLAHRARNRQPEKPLTQSSGNPMLDRNRAALALNCIGQVWGNAPLSLTIGQFYRRAVQQPESATAVAFTNELSQRLPDSLRYLTTYLSQSPTFAFRLGRVAKLFNGITVEIITQKWLDTSDGPNQTVPINDYVPLAVLDAGGHVIHRVLAHPNPDERDVYLPPLPNAQSVVVDPLGTWPERNKRDNVKRL